MQKVDGLILILTCQNHIKDRMIQFPVSPCYGGWKVIHVVGNLFIDEPFTYQIHSTLMSVLTLKCEDSYVHLLKKLVLAIEAVNTLFIIKDGILRANDTLVYNEERLNTFLASYKPDFYGYNPNKNPVYCPSFDIMKNSHDDDWMVRYYDTHPQDFENPLHNIKGMNIKNYTRRPYIEGVWGKLIYLSNYACDILVKQLKKINYDIFSYDEPTQSYPYVNEDCAISYILYMNSIPLHHSSLFVTRHTTTTLKDVVANAYDMRIV